MAIIEVKKLRKYYKVNHQRVEALNGVSFKIEQGEFVAISGASGSGKSTLLQLIGGLDKPTDGDIVVDGVNIKSMSDRKLSVFRNKTIGFVFQFFYLQPFLTLRKNIEIAAMPARIKRKDRNKNIEKYAKKVGLIDRLDHYPNELSGGQIQRAAVIRALMNNPKIILADEPTGNLDSKNTEAVVKMLRDICDETGATVVVVSHDPDVCKAADRIIKMKDGMIYD